MKPYVICHMLMTADGKTDARSFHAFWSKKDNDAIFKELNGQGWICGSRTMREFAEDGHFRSKTQKIAGEPSIFVARRSDSYAVAVDSRGSLLWNHSYVEGDHLVCFLSEQAPTDYLCMLRDKGISYVVAGREQVDLSYALRELSQHFGVERIILQGGGHINGGFLAQNLVDELSILMIPGLDGRHEYPSLFDGIANDALQTVPLQLKSVVQREKDCLWIRYAIQHI